MLSKYFRKKTKDPSNADIVSMLEDLILIAQRQERLLTAMHKAIVEIKKNTTEDSGNSK